jgi:hypothetical protein
VAAAIQLQASFYTIEMSHDKEFLTFYVAGSCPGSVFNGTYTWADACPFFVTDVCQPGQIIPTTTCYKAAGGRIEVAFATNDNSGPWKVTFTRSVPQAPRGSTTCPGFALQWGSVSIFCVFDAWSRERGA